MPPSDSRPSPWERFRSSIVRLLNTPYGLLYGLPLAAGLVLLLLVQWSPEAKPATVAALAVTAVSRLEPKSVLLSPPNDSSYGNSQAVVSRSLVDTPGGRELLVRVDSSDWGDLDWVYLADSTAQVWSSDGRYLVTLSDDTSDVPRVAFSSDGRRILTVSNDGTIRLWDHEGHIIAERAGDGTPVSKIPSYNIVNLTWQIHRASLPVLMSNTGRSAPDHEVIVTSYGRQTLSWSTPLTPTATLAPGPSVSAGTQNSYAPYLSVAQPDTMAMGHAQAVLSTLVMTTTPPVAGQGMGRAAPIPVAMIGPKRGAQPIFESTLNQDYEVYVVAQLNAVTAFEQSPAPDGHQEQQLLPGRPAEFAWTLNPKLEGTQSVLLTVDLRWVPLNGGREFTERIYSEEIVLTVAPQMVQWGPAVQLSSTLYNMLTFVLGGLSTWAAQVIVEHLKNRRLPVPVPEPVPKAGRVQRRVPCIVQTCKRPHGVPRRKLP